MLSNAYFVAKIGADTAENEQHFAEILPTDALWRLRLGAAELHAKIGPLLRRKGLQREDFKLRRGEIKHMEQRLLSTFKSNFELGRILFELFAFELFAFI